MLYLYYSACVLITCFTCYNDILQSDAILYPHCDDIDHTERRGDAPSD